MYCRSSSQRGSAALEFAVVVFPLFSVLTFGIYLCTTLVTLAQAHREVSFSGTNAVAAVNSSYLPPQSVWKQFFVNHSSSALQLEAINHAQSQYGFVPGSSFHLAAANYAAASAQRNGQAYGITATPEASKKQLGLKFSPEWYSVLVKVPGLAGFTLHATTMNPSSGAASNNGSGGSQTNYGDADGVVSKNGKKGGDGPSAPVGGHNMDAKDVFGKPFDIKF